MIRPAVFSQASAIFTRLSTRSFSTTPSAAMKHHLMIGTWVAPGRIYTVQFDDEALTLELVKKTEIPEAEPISWMTFSHDKKTIYGAAMKKWNSFAVNSPTDIVHQVSHPVAGHPLAPSAETNTRAIFVLAAKQAPFNVYGNPFYKYAGYGNVFSVKSDGALDVNVQNYEYQENTGIHGMVFDPTETYLYSADLTANKIWTHKKDAQTGQLELVDCLEAPAPGDHPRWVEMHHTGKYLYVLMEAGNRLGVYVIDERTHKPVFTHITYPLLPSGLPPRNKYRGDVTFTTKSGDYLFATTRSNHFDVTGYITAFKLGPSGEIERQLFINPTSTSGGHSNAVSPCDFTDEWVAICDDQLGFVEMYRWRDEKLARVARCDIPEQGFGMNAIWYD
ncbi:Carboxy-cis-cis-muconate cyclase [Penicillium tannophilum]|nr:Carboxy-cis-cis-muconate cyclase [Penicillium tannophilum]